MSATVVVRKRRTSARCAVCHDVLAGDRRVCPLCNTALHAECRAQLGRCPTLGCGRARTPLPVRREAPVVRPVAEPETLGSAVLRSCVTALGVLVGGLAAGPKFLAVAILLHFLLVPGWTAERFRRWRGLASFAGGVVVSSFFVFCYEIGLALVVVPMWILIAAGLGEALGGVVVGLAALVLVPALAGWFAGHTLRGLD